MNTIKAVDRFHINLSQLLGQGSFAKVYKAFDAQDMTIEAAVKMVSLAKLQRNKEGLDLFAREVEVLEKIKSKHIAQLLDVKMTPNHLYMFMEFCDGGSLGTHLAKGRTFTEEEACSIIRQVASAFVDIENLSLTNKHGEKVTVMHRDIKPDNILFHKGQIKVADFGFAKLVSEGGRTLKRAHTLCGTPCYEAPQILNRQLYSAKCDIWSTGVVFYELLFGIIPWARNPAARLEHAVQARPLYFPKTISNETKDLIHRMLMVREEDRISWREVLRHPALSLKQDIMREPVKLITQPLSNERAWTPYPNKKNIKNDNGQHTDRLDRADYGPYKQQEKEKREYAPYKQERMKTEDYAPYKQEKRTGQRLDVSPMKGEAAPINKQEGLAWPKLDTLQPRKTVQDKENLKVEPLKTLQNKTFALKTEVQVTPKFVSSKELLELEAKYKRSVIERRY